MSLLLAAALLALQDRLPVPEEAARRQAEKLVRETFKEEYAKGSPSERASFAGKLLKQAQDTRDDPPTCFVLFAQAEDQAALSGEIDLLGKVIDSFGRSFQVDMLALKEGALQRLPSRTPEEAKRCASAWNSVGAELLSAGEFERAEKAGAAAAAQARKAKDVPAVTQAESLSREAGALKGKYKGVVQARQALSANDEDPAANALVGRFECFVRGQWASGLPRLAKGSEPALQAAAQEELPAPEDPAKRVAAADAWVAVADKETGSTRTAILRHAGDLYRSAVGSLSGLQKLKVEKRLEDILREAGSSQEVNLIALLDMKEDLVKGTWSLSGTSLVCTSQLSILEIPYTPPAEYDLRVLVERKGGSDNLLLGLVVGGHQAAVSMDEKGDLTGFGRIDGQKPEQNGTAVHGKVLLPDKETLLVVSVRKTGVSFSAAGKQLIDWKGDASRLSRNPTTPIRRPDVLYLASTASQYEIRKMVLVPVSGEGKKIR